jgi:DNA-binding response OmpR family regulator
MDTPLDWDRFVSLAGGPGSDVDELARTAFVPILMLTRNSDEAHRTKGFVVGTDDFMAKPFSVPELTARVTRLLRRTYGL